MDKRNKIKAQVRPFYFQTEEYALIGPTEQNLHALTGYLATSQQAQKQHLNIKRAYLE
jgi:hypothetical protein